MAVGDQSRLKVVGHVPSAPLLNPVSGALPSPKPRYLLPDVAAVHKPVLQH